MGMHPVNVYSVWRNKDDKLIALDETATVCASLMGITRQKFYTYVKTPCKKWTIMKTELEEEEYESTDYYRQPC